jgi:hypothetical protein
MRRLPHVFLALVLAAAALLRFAGLGGDLVRGSPTPDEWVNFVGPVAQMWSARSADPHVHSGYPGFFNWVVFLPMGLGERRGGEAGATKAARAVVASFATLNVLLVYFVVRRPWGEWAALLAAALLAFSRSEVSEAHYITPDVLVVSAFLALLLTARSERFGAWAGVWAGLGTAVKYSGVLLLPALFAELAAQRRCRRLAAAAAVAGATFAAAAPFALLGKRDQQRGVRELVDYYFAPLLSGGALQTVPRQLGEVGAWMWINLGPVAVALALAAAFARPRRPLAAPAAALLASLAVLSFAGQVYPRHILLASAAATILAGAGFSVARARLPAAAAAALAAVTLAVPLTRAVRVAHGYTQPTELDAAAEWIESQGRPLRVATSLERLRLHGPIEVRAGLPLWSWAPEPLGHFDLLLAPRDVAERLTSLRVLRTFERAGNEGGALLALAGPGAPEPAWPAPHATRATAPGGERAWDGDARSAWTAPPGPGWIEAEWEEARELHVIEITVPAGEGYWPQRLRMFARREGAPPETAWTAVDGIAIRPARAALQQPPHGQVFVLPEPFAAKALRIERRGDGKAWGLAEVRAFSPAAPDAVPPRAK